MCVVLIGVQKGISMCVKKIIKQGKVKVLMLVCVCAISLVVMQVPSLVYSQEETKFMQDRITVTFTDDVDVHKEMEAYFQKRDYEILDVAYKKIDISIHEFTATVINKTDEEVYYTLYVDLKNEDAPVIEGKDVELEVGSSFDASMLEIKAYDTMLGDIAYEVTANTVDTNTAGVYVYEVQATTKNHKTTKKTFRVQVKEAKKVEQETQTHTQVASRTVQGLDRSQLSVNGWKVIVNDPAVSDATIQAYLQELANCPQFLKTAPVTYISINTTELDANKYFGYTYFTDNHIWLNGKYFHATTATHELTHLYDVPNGQSKAQAFLQVYESEKYQLPARYCQNISDNHYEWFAELVVFYIYDRSSLQNQAPQSYAYISKYF